MNSPFPRPATLPVNRESALANHLYERWRAVWNALVLFLLIALAVPVVYGADEEVDKLKSLRATFDKKVEASFDRHAEKARALRTNYLEALKKLKATLGKEQNLKEAAEVLKEIQAIENADELPTLSGRSSSRLTQLRKKWEIEFKTLVDDRGAELRRISALYVKALEVEKSRLTRSGEIRSALEVEEEVKRVRRVASTPTAETPAGSLKFPEPPTHKRGLEAYLTYSVWSFKSNRFSKEPDYLLFLPNGRIRIWRDRTVDWKATSATDVEFGAPTWSGKAKIRFSQNYRSYAGTNAVGGKISGEIQALRVVTEE